MTVVRFMIRWHLVPTLFSLFFMGFGAVQLWNYEPVALGPHVSSPIPYEFIYWLLVIGGAYLFVTTYFAARRMARGR